MLNQMQLWVDTDVSIGLEYFPGIYRDIDDALALITLFNSPLVNLCGVSSTFANTTTDKSFKIATELVQKFGPQGVQVHKGAHGPIDPDKDLPISDATWAMADALRKTPLTIVSLGAATNVAVFIKQYPELVDRIQGIVAMAGSRRSPGQDFFVGPNQHKPFSALNFEKDVEAWRILLASNVPITFASFEACHQVWITEDDIKDLKATGGDTGQYLAPYMHKWAREWKTLYGSKGFNPFDALASGVILAPGLITGDDMPVGILEPGEGGNNRDVPCLICSESMTGDRRATYLHAVNPAFKPFLMDTLKGGMQMSTHVLAQSHISIVVDDIDKASEFYNRVLGFQQAYNMDGPIYFKGYKNAEFARDAGFLDGDVDIDVLFMIHPQAGLYLEIMKYTAPQGEQEVLFRKTNDMGGVRHVALEVADIEAVYAHLKKQPDVQMINPSPSYGPPEQLGQMDISFFYWLDPYGVQWEMECGRPICMGGREIAG